MHIVNSISLTELAQLLDEANIVVYPTDTIYGIGCDATNHKAVMTIKRIKTREGNRPYSVIAPSKEWIKENCEVNEIVQEYLDKLPGPYTLILKLKNPVAVDRDVKGKDESLGVRIPKHWISDAVAMYGKPVITTSVNLAGESPATSIAEVPESLAREIDLGINDGPCDNAPSTIVDLREEVAAILR